MLGSGQEADVWVRASGSMGSDRTLGRQWGLEDRMHENEHWRVIGD